MYALIYDEFDPQERNKQVVSLHKTRQGAEKALRRRQRELGKRVWECHTRIVWIDHPVNPMGTVTPDLFDTWAPHEEIPDGDRVPDGD